MRSKCGEGQIPGDEARQRPSPIAASVDRRAAGLARDGVAVAVATGMLARLDRFGLAITGEPLLEPERERT